MTMSTSETICRFNQTGFCKYAARCRKQHVMEICLNRSCNIATCMKRHPRVCKFFLSYGRCKFDNSCAYLHRPLIECTDEKLRKLEQDQMEEITKLKGEIVILKKEIDNLKIAVGNKSKILSCRSRTYSSNMGITLVNDTNASSSILVESIPTNAEQHIPQLDGPMDMVALAQLTSQLNCENCGKIFHTKDAFKSHNDEHEWGCEDCSVCLTSKYLFDLHEMEYHPDSTSYIRDHIPESTKKLFETGHRQR